MVYFFVYFLLL